LIGSNTLDIVLSIVSILVMVEDARLLAQVLRDDMLVPTFTLWKETLKRIQGSGDRSRGYGRVSDAQRTFDLISQERREVSKKTDDVQQRISNLRQDLSRLEQELEELRNRHSSLCIQEDAAQKFLSTVQQASDSSVTIDDETSHSVEEVFKLTTRESEGQQETRENCLSGLLVSLRDVGRVGHPVGHPVVRPVVRPVGHPVGHPVGRGKVSSHDPCHGQVLRSGRTVGITQPVALIAQLHSQTQDEGNGDAIESQSQGTDTESPNNKPRESGLTALQPINETILDGVAEELGDQDFVPFV
jgi:hypothetical protein